MPLIAFFYVLLGVFIFNMATSLRLFVSPYIGLRKSVSAVLWGSIGKNEKLGGRVVVTGIGQVEEDEFTMNLLLEQNIWSTISLATSNPELAKKRFLTRTARYSGLLDVLEFPTIRESEKSEQLPALLDGANAWVAFNVPESELAVLTATAINAKLKRVIYTVQLPEHRINDTQVPDLDASAQAFAESGIYFTGIRHGTIVPGNEDNAYEIVNATLPLIDSKVERGVLGRVVTELLRTDSAYGKICGVSSSNAFAGAYLNILRSSGLTRHQEVEKIFSGGIQRVAQLTAREREAETKRQEELVAAEEKRKADEVLEQKRNHNHTLAAITTSASTITSSSRARTSREKEDSALSVDFDALDEEGGGDSAEQLTDETLISIRANEILANVWMEFNARMISKSTSKSEFYETNMDMATALAAKELQQDRDRRKKIELEKEAAFQMTDQVAELERKQYAKLLALERREMLNQKQISDTWVRYIYALLEVTCAHCAGDKVRFEDLGVPQQSLLLRAKANELRARFHLPPYEAIYDPLDASAIVQQLTADPVLREELQFGDTTEEVAQRLSAKYNVLLDTVPALRAASHIVELAIDTLRRELPPAPAPLDTPAGLTVPLSKATLEGKRKTRRRGGPMAEEESVV